MDGVQERTMYWRRGRRLKKLAIIALWKKKSKQNTKELKCDESTVWLQMDDPV